MEFVIVIEQLKERQYIPDSDPAPRIVVLMAVIMSIEGGNAQFLICREQKSDQLKESGQMSLAGAETAKVVDGGPEGRQATLLGVMAEEVFGRVSDSREIEFTYVDLGDFWWDRDLGVLARLMTVRLEADQAEVGPSDPETSDYQWVGPYQLSEVENWRPGMEDMLRILPILREHYLISRETEGKCLTMQINGYNLDRFRRARAEFLDTKDTSFTWRLN